MLINLDHSIYPSLYNKSIYPLTEYSQHTPTQLIQRRQLNLRDNELSLIGKQPSIFRRRGRDSQRSHSRRDRSANLQVFNQEIDKLSQMQVSSNRKRGLTPNLIARGSEVSAIKNSFVGSMTKSMKTDMGHYRARKQVNKGQRGRRGEGQSWISNKDIQEEGSGKGQQRARSAFGDHMRAQKGGKRGVYRKSNNTQNVSNTDRALIMTNANQRSSQQNNVVLKPGDHRKYSDNVIGQKQAPRIQNSNQRKISEFNQTGQDQTQNIKEMILRSGYIKEAIHNIPNDSSRNTTNQYTTGHTKMTGKGDDSMERRTIDPSLYRAGEDQGYTSRVEKGVNLLLKKRVSGMGPRLRGNLGYYATVARDGQNNRLYNRTSEMVISQKNQGGAGSGPRVVTHTRVVKGDQTRQIDQKTKNNRSNQIYKRGGQQSQNKAMATDQRMSQVQQHLNQLGLNSYKAISPQDLTDQRGRLTQDQDQNQNQKTRTQTNAIFQNNQNNQNQDQDRSIPKITRDSKNSQHIFKQKKFLSTSPIRSIHNRSWKAESRPSEPKQPYVNRESYPASNISGSRFGLDSSHITEFNTHQFINQTNSRGANKEGNMIQNRVFQNSHYDPNYGLSNRSNAQDGNFPKNPVSRSVYTPQTQFGQNKGQFMKHSTEMTQQYERAANGGNSKVIYRQSENLALTAEGRGTFPRSFQRIATSKKNPTLPLKKKNKMSHQYVNIRDLNNANPQNSTFMKHQNVYTQRKVIHGQPSNNQHNQHNLNNQHNQHNKNSNSQRIYRGTTKRSSISRSPSDFANRQGSSHKDGAMSPNNIQIDAQAKYRAQRSLISRDTSLDKQNKILKNEDQGRSISVKGGALLVKSKSQKRSLLTSQKSFSKVGNKPVSISKKGEKMDQYKLIRYGKRVND